ncbi:MAG: glycosyltransferase, partial [Bacteroidetes bacterium]
VGTLSASQNPEGLWRALAALERSGACPALRLHFVGKVDPVVLGRVEAAGLRERLDLTPYVPHREAIGYMQAADLLLLSINRAPGAEGIVTGKLFEYLASGRPVLGLGPPEGDAAALLRATGGGVMFAHDDPDAIRAYVAAQYADWEAGRRREGARPEALLPYTRPALTERLAAVLVHVTARTVRPT